MNREKYVSLGLYDPHAPDAEERLKLLEELGRFGHTPEELALIDEQYGLTWVPMLAPFNTTGYSVEEVAAEVGVSADAMERYLRTAGLPRFDRTERPFDDADIDMFRSWTAVREFLGLELGEQLLRTAGASCARLAETGIATFVEVIGSDEIDTGTTDLERIEYNERALAAYFGASNRFTTLLRHHMRAAAERWRIADTHSPERRVRFFVGFVDLVGYTPLSQHLSTDELARLFDHFETVALNASAAHNGRIVKHIGDEVMFVANTAAAGLDIALTMVEEFRHESGETTPRGGVAVGDLLAREGDYYGPAVNLASRIADLAVPEEVLASEDVRVAADAGDGGFEFVGAGRRQLKGFPEPVQLWAAQRA